MTTEQFKMRDYHIVNAPGKSIDAVAQFLYKGYQISFSTNGLSEGACQSEVAIFGKKDDADKNWSVRVKPDCLTVQEAIEFIDNLVGFIDYKALFKDALVHLRSVCSSRNSFSSEAQERLYPKFANGFTLRSPGIEYIHHQADSFLIIHNKD